MKIKKKKCQLLCINNRKYLSVNSKKVSTVYFLRKFLQVYRYLISFLFLMYNIIISVKFYPLPFSISNPDQKFQSSHLIKIENLSSTIHKKLKMTNCTCTSKTAWPILVVSTFLVDFYQKFKLFNRSKLYLGKILVNQEIISIEFF